MGILMLCIIDFHKIYKFQCLLDIMGNLAQKIATLTLIGAGLVGCATYQPKAESPKEQEASSPIIIPGIDLGNGYHAESYFVEDMIDTLTGVRTGEVTIKANQEGLDYKIIKIKETSRYDLTSPDKWACAYNDVCKALDKGDKFISEAEVQKYINQMFEVTLAE